MLKTILNMLLLVFFSLGICYLPMGNFSILKDLPEMYRHCKATEDKDLDFFEFLTEHVSPIGQLVAGAKHEAEEDDDKPHEPIHTIQIGQSSVFLIARFAFYFTSVFFLKENFSIHNDYLLGSDFRSKLFRPPINGFLIFSLWSKG